MKRIFIIHRWDGYPEGDWYPWVKKELEDKGYQVNIPRMPHPENPTIKDWVNFLSKAVRRPDEDTFFIGHSIGCQTILRYLETLNTENQMFDINKNPIPRKKIGGAVFVAGWFNLNNLEDEETEKIAKPWIETPINIKKVKVALPKSTLIISENDPYDCFEENTKKFREIGSNMIVLNNAGHITSDDGFVELPEILEALK